MQIQRAQLQLQVVELEVCQILLGLFQKRLRVAHIVPADCLGDPAVVLHRLVRLDIEAAAVHTLYRQVGVQRLDGAVVQPAAQRNNHGGILRGIPVAGEVDEIGPELDDLTASVRVLLQVIQIPHPIRLPDPEMASVGFHQSVEQLHRLRVIGVVGGEVLVHHRHRADGKLPVGADFGVVNGNQLLQILPNRFSGILRRRLNGVVEKRQFPLTVEHPVVPEVLALRKRPPRPNLLSVFLHGNIRDHADNAVVGLVGVGKGHLQRPGRAVLQRQLGVDHLHVIQREHIIVDAHAVRVNAIHPSQPPHSEIHRDRARAGVAPQLQRGSLAAEEHKLRELDGAVGEQLCLIQPQRWVDKPDVYAPLV